MEQVLEMPTLQVKATDLPSRGVGYPENTVFTYTNYTFGDYHAASNSDTSAEMVFKKAMEGIKANSPIKVKDISIIDFFMIGLLRRVTSQKDLSFEIEYDCQKCKNKNTLIFTSTDIKFEKLSEEVKALPAKVTIAGKELHFGFLTVQNVLDSNSGSIKVKNKKANNEFSMLAMTVKNIPFEEAYEHLQNVKDPKDFLKLEKISKLMYMEINPLKAVCKHKDEDQACGHTNMIDLEGKESLIRPFLKPEELDADEIRFGD